MGSPEQTSEQGGGSAQYGVAKQLHSHHPVPLPPGWQRQPPCGASHASRAAEISARHAAGVAVVTYSRSHNESVSEPAQSAGL